MDIFITKHKIGKKIITVLSLISFCIIGTIVFSYKNVGVISLSQKKLPIYSVDTKEKKVSITFDTSWGENNTTKILDILDKYNIKATFFIIGKWMDEFPEDVKNIYQRGHELSNHSNKHPDFTMITKEKIGNEIDVTDAKIFALTGVKPILFRCPEGTYNNFVIQTVEATNHYCVQWDVDSIDWREDGSEIEYERVIKKTKAGSIILFHNNAKYTPENLSRIIEKLQKDGYNFVTVCDLIYKNDYYLNNEGKQILNKPIVN